MTSAGPSTQPTNFTHMFNMMDLRGVPKNTVQRMYPNSLMSIIDKHPDMRKYKYMVNLSGLGTILSEYQANITIFVPSDNMIRNLGDEIFINMDQAVAKHIIKSTMINRKIPSELLESSKYIQFITKDHPNKLYVTNENGETFLNNGVKVIHKDIIASNGIIHVIDNLIIPYII